MSQNEKCPQFSQRCGPLAACGDEADAVERVAMATVTELMKESAPVFTRMTKH